MRLLGEVLQRRGHEPPCSLVTLDCEQAADENLRLMSLRINRSYGELLARRL